MPSAITARHQLPLLPLLVVGLLAIALMGRMSDGIADALVTERLADVRLDSRALGIDPDAVSASTVVHLPTGELAGPTGIEAFVASLQRDHPGARFVVTDTSRAGRLFIVGWRGTSGGDVVIHGRTLITIEDGRVTQVMFLNLNDTSSAEVASSQHPELATTT